MKYFISLFMGVFLFSGIALSGISDVQAVQSLKLDAPTQFSGLVNKSPEDAAISIVGTVIQYVLGFAGALALLFFIYGGATILLSGGSPDKITKGKMTLAWAVVGLLMSFTAYIILNYIIITITRAGGGS